MGDYTLKTKSGEKIKTIQATCIEEAVELFSKIKNLNSQELTKIYLVERAS